MLGTVNTCDDDDDNDGGGGGVGVVTSQHLFDLTGTTWRSELVYHLESRLFIRVDSVHIHSRLHQQTSPHSKFVYLIITTPTN